MPDTDGAWRRWYALWPVTVDAYSVSDIKDGQMSYTVALKWVERRWAPVLERNDTTDQDEIPAHWEYRLPQDDA